MLRGSRLGAVRTALGLCLFALAAPAPDARAQLSHGSVRVVDTLRTRAGDLVSANTAQLLADVASRRLFEARSETAAGQRVLLDVYDLDTLAYRNTVAVDSGEHSGALGSVVDETSGRVFVGYYKLVAPAVRQPWMAVVDQRTLRVTARYTLTDAVRGGQVFAVSHFAPEDKLYVVGEAATPPVSPGDSATSTTLLAQMNASTGQVDWLYPVPACQRPLGTNVSNGIPGPVGRSAARGFVYFACTVNQPTASSRFPGTPAVVRVAVASRATQVQAAAFRTETFPIGGEFYAGFVDTVTDRVFLVNKAFGAQGVTVFDGRRDVFLGTIALNNAPAQIGLDAESGRVAFVDGTPGTTGGLTLADGRATPLAQGLFFPQVKSGRGGLIVADPPTRRWFVKFRAGDHDPTKDAVLPVYLVLEDRSPTFAQPEAADPDVNTLDAEEQAGVTGANYSAGASSFGARSLTVGGLGAAQDNMFGIELGFSIRQRLTGIDRLLPIHPRLGDPFFASPGDRDLYFGRATRAFQSAADNSALAVAVDRDVNTDGDLFNASHPSGPTPDARDPSLTGQPRDLNATGHEMSWPYTGVQCADFGAGGGTAEPEEGLGGFASVSCNHNSRAVSAEASWEGTLPSDVSVWRASASARAYRDDTLGAVSMARSEATGIRVGGVLRIDRVATSAQSAAKGRPGTAGGRFTRVVEGIRVANPLDPSTALFSCSTADICATALPAAQQAVGAASGGHIQIFFPEPDHDLMRGSPGGYEALVRKDADQVLEDKGTNNDDRTEVPGLVVIVFNDNHSRSREVLQFAGVQAESHYGIFRLPGATQVLGAALAAAGPPLPPDPPAARALPAQPPAALPKPAVLPAFRTVVKTFVDGFRFAFSSPGQFAGAVTVWSFFAAPLYLVLRRRQALKDLA